MNGPRLNLIQDRPSPPQSRQESTPFLRGQSKIDGTEKIQRSVVKRYCDLASTQIPLAHTVPLAHTFCHYTAAELCDSVLYFPRLFAQLNECKGGRDYPVYRRQYMISMVVR